MRYVDMCVTRGGRGGSYPCPFLKIGKMCPNLEKKFLGGIFCYCYVGGSFCCNLEGDCICCNYAVRSFWSTHSGDSSAAKIWVTIFVVIMQMGVSVGIMLVVFSVMYYTHDCFYCNYAGKSFF